ncbi:MAG: SDR family NAD(P)-dependent oxidoreductase, partial [Verrucomicrobiota bacterium]
MSGTDRLLGRGLVIKEGYGPWAVVTGASSGIGRETAVQLAGAGMNLLLVARRGLLLQDLAGELSRSTGVLVKTLVLDLSRESATAELIAATEDIDVGLYVGAAGFGSSGLFIDSTVDREKDMIMVNCLAVLTQTHHFARRFAKRGSGGLVLMGSLVGFQGAPLAGHYAA